VKTFALRKEVEVRRIEPIINTTNCIFCNCSNIVKFGSHAATLSRLPSSRLRVPDIDKQANFADSYPCSTDTSFVPNLSKGPATKPS
jgi:hypothetical protein